MYTHILIMIPCVNCVVCAIPVAILAYRLYEAHFVQMCLFCASFLLCCFSYVRSVLSVGNSALGDDPV